MSSIAEPMRPFVSWPSIFAGAVAAAGVSFTLHAFAVGIGLSVISASPTWRDSSAWLWLITGIYLVFVSLCAFGLGGYLAGRLRPALSVSPAEVHFRDGVSGLVMWGLAVILTAVLTIGAVALVTPARTEGPASSVASNAETVLATELDGLFRSDRLPADITLRRAEVSRILLKTSSRSGLTNDDRLYLTDITETATGAPPDEAARRVDRAIADSRDELHRARVAAVLQAFFIAAALLIGAAVSWFSACEGGLDRERGTFPVWDWKLPRRGTLVRGN